MCIRDRYLYTQRVDLVAQNANTGKIWFIDNKTTFKILPKTIKRYELSGQVLGYNMFGSSMFGDKYGGVMMNMIGWGGKGPPEFQRVMMPPAPFSQKRFTKTLLHAERIIDLHEGREPGDWLGAHLESACCGTYGPCKYFERCHYGE